LENLAIKLTEKRQANRILQIQDTFTSFVPLQHDIFSLGIPKSYFAEDSDKIVSGLLSLFVTLNEIPFLTATRWEEQDSNHKAQT
jgi:hypothetical protein